MKRMFRYLKPYKILAIFSPLIMMGEVLGDLLLPTLMSFIVDYGITGISVFDAEKGSTVAAAIIQFFHGTDFTRMDIIVTFGILMLVVTLFGGFFGVLCAYTAARAAQSMGRDLRRDAYSHVMSLSIQQTDRFTTGSLITRMTSDVTIIVDFFEYLMRGFVRAPLFLLGGAVMLIALDLRFSCVILCTIPVLAVVLLLVLRKAIPMYGVIQQRLDKINSIVQENVSGARVVKAYVRENYECERFETANTALYNVNYDVLKLMAVISPVLTILLNVAVTAVIYIGGLSISIEAAGMTTGSVMAAVTYITQILNAVMMATNMFQQISRAGASAKRVNEILDTEPALHGGEADAPDMSGDTAISFKNVSFSYPGTVGNPVLKNINLDIKKGETLAIIGATGSGKSSLASLVPRFYDTTGGDVLIDGRSVKDYSLAGLRSKIGYVMQKSELFSDTMENNIRWGKKDATDAEISAAAKNAEASEFINSFTDGFKTFIAEKGASLSGGQKQRMSLARALVRKPDILILDDATSALDLVTEGKVRKTIREKLKGTTVIMIAQRIASVMEADRIAVLENDGVIKYCGTHEELLKVSDTYRDIYDSQMKSGAYIVAAEMEGHNNG